MRFFLQVRAAPTGPRNKCGVKGFSILELSIVLVIIGTVMAASSVLFSAYLKDQQLKETQAKLDTIQRALLNFRQAYDRLPCPADVLTGMAGAANAADDAADGALFGAAARMWYDPSSSVIACTNYDTNTYDASTDRYIPSANYIEDARTNVGQGWNGSGTYPYSTVAMGMVPTRTLGLPDDYAIDGWGRRIMYAVDFTATAPSLTNIITLPDTGGPNGIRMYINDKSDNQKSALGLYVVISYGPNGHGGFPRGTDRSPLFGGTGTPVNINSVNAQEIVNCNCDSASAYAAGYPTDSNWVPGTFLSGYNGGLVGTFDTVNNATYSWYYVAPAFFQDLQQSNSSFPDGTYDFDDIVVFGTRASLPAYSEQ